METVGILLGQSVIVVIVGICLLCAIGVIAACVVGGGSDNHFGE